MGKHSNSEPSIRFYLDSVLYMVNALARRQFERIFMLKINFIVVLYHFYTFSFESIIVLVLRICMWWRIIDVYKCINAYNVHNEHTLSQHISFNNFNNINDKVCSKCFSWVVELGFRQISINKEKKINVFLSFYISTIKYCVAIKCIIKLGDPKC